MTWSDRIARSRAAAPIGPSAVLTSLQADGQPGTGWILVSPEKERHVRQSMLDQGFDALKDLAPSDPRRAEIRGWIEELGSDPTGRIPTGTYPLEGRRALIIQEATSETLAHARNRARMPAPTVTRAAPKPAQRPASAMTSSALQARIKRLK